MSASGTSYTYSGEGARLLPHRPIAFRRQCRQDVDERARRVQYGRGSSSKATQAPFSLKPVHSQCVRTLHRNEMLKGRNGRDSRPYKTLHQKRSCLNCGEWCSQSAAPCCANAASRRDVQTASAMRATLESTKAFTSHLSSCPRRPPLVLINRYRHRPQQHVSNSGSSCSSSDSTGTSSSWRPTKRVCTALRE